MTDEALKRSQPFTSKLQDSVDVVWTGIHNEVNKTTLKDLTPLKFQYEYQKLTYLKKKTCSIIFQTYILGILATCPGLSKTLSPRKTNWSPPRLKEQHLRSCSNRPLQGFVKIPVVTSPMNKLLKINRHGG